MLYYQLVIGLSINKRCVCLYYNEDLKLALYSHNQSIMSSMTILMVLIDAAQGAIVTN